MSIFSGKLCFLLKDVQPAAARNVQAEFLSKVVAMQAVQRQASGLMAC
jgi:hypothetical protein